MVVGLASLVRLDVGLKSYNGNVYFTTTGKLLKNSELNSNSTST